MRLLVQHHPSRARELERLARSLEPHPVEIVVDPDPGAHVRSAWRTYRACLERIASADEPAVVLQDDAVCCPGFATAADRVARVCSDRLVAYFHGPSPGGFRRWIRDACERADPFVQLPAGRWVPTVALAWPAELARQFLRWLDHDRKPLPGHWVADDPLVGEWAGRAGVLAVATVPSLVEHPDDTASLVSPRRPQGQRTAYLWIGDTPVEEWLSLLPLDVPAAQPSTTPASVTAA